jgi:RNA polymerase sigma-70 factor (ECF subfamily)
MKTDEELMLEVKDGREEAFAILVERYTERILNFLFRIIGNKYDSEDLTQEVFLRLYKSRKKYSPTAKFSTYIFRIASNVVKSFLKHSERKYDFHSLYEQIDETHKLSDVIPDPSSIERKVLAYEIGKKIQEAIASLPEELYIVFTLSEDENMDYQEISEILQIPKGTVASRKNAAVKILRKKLKKLKEEINGGINVV